MTPNAARRSAYGSFDPVGFSSIAEKTGPRELLAILGRIQGVVADPDFTDPATPVPPAAGVDYDPEHGVRVNDYLQTSNRLLKPRQLSKEPRQVRRTSSAARARAWARR